MQHSQKRMISCHYSMPTDELSAPASDELEVSVFGPGYGEAISVHLGGGNWILVDSCKESESDSPASLAYLKRLDVDPSKAVRLIVATHWHNDHVRGISQIVDACPRARFVMSSALREREFGALLQVYSKSPSV